MGRGSHTSSFYPSHSHRYRRHCYSEHAQRYLDHPKPKSWLTALEDHPALSTSNVQPPIRKTIPHETVETIKVEFIKEKVPPDANEVDQSSNPDDEEEEENNFEKVYEKHEIISVIDKWIKAISNPDISPWSEGDLRNKSSLVLKPSEYLDPFHSFDWNRASSHKGRLMKLVFGSYNSQG